MSFCCWFYPKPKRLTSTFMLLSLQLPSSSLLVLVARRRPPTVVVHLPSPATFSPKVCSLLPPLHFPWLTITLCNHNPNTFTTLFHLIVFPTLVNHQWWQHQTLQLCLLSLQNDIVTLLQHPCLPPPPHVHTTPMTPDMTLRVCKTLGFVTTLIVTFVVVCNVVGSESTQRIACYHNGKVIGVGFVVRRMESALRNMS